MNYFVFAYQPLFDLPPYRTFILSLAKQEEFSAEQTVLEVTSITVVLYFFDERSSVNMNRYRGSCNFFILVTDKKIKAIHRGHVRNF